jgi:hypothetical protein
MDSDYLLWHVREVEGCEDELFIGVYSAEQQARDAIERLKDKPGFMDYPNGIQIHAHKLNLDGWPEDFIFTTD